MIVSMHIDTIAAMDTTFEMMQDKRILDIEWLWMTDVGWYYNCAFKVIAIANPIYNFNIINKKPKTIQDIFLTRVVAFFSLSDLEHQDIIYI